MSDTTQGAETPMVGQAPPPAPAAVEPKAPAEISEDEAFPRTIDEDEAFPPLTARQQRAGIHAMIGGSGLQDFIFGDADLSEGIPIVGGSAANKLRPLFNTARETYRAFKEGMAGPLVPSEEAIHGLSEGAADFLKKHGLVKEYADGQKEVTDAADNTFLKPSATEKAIDSAIRGIVSSPVYQGGVVGVRGFSALWAAAQHGVYTAGQEFGFPKLAADLAAFPEAFPTGHEFAGVPHALAERPPPPTQRVLAGLPEHPPLAAAELENAKSLGILESEEAWKNGAPPAPAEGVKAGTEPGAPPPIGTPLPEITVTAGEGEGAKDIHAAAREIAPEAIKEFDELTKRRDTFRKWMEDRESTPPANLAQSLKETEVRLKELEPEVTAAYDKAREGMPVEAPAESATAANSAVPDWVKENREAAVSAADALGLTPQIAAMAREGRTAKEISEAIGGKLSVDEVRAVRESQGIEAAGPLMTPGGAVLPTETPPAETMAVVRPIEDRRAPESIHSIPQDIFGDISAAVIDSSVAEDGTTRIPLKPEEIEALRKAGISVSDSGAISEVDREAILGERDRRNAQERANKSAAPAKSIEDQRATIAHDVGRQLVLAGRPPEEAAAAAQLTAARYIARAERMKGALGTPEELYAREGAEIRSAQIRAKVKTPADARALDDFQQRMAVGKDQAQARRNEGSSAVQVMTTAQRYAGVTKEEFEAQRAEQLWGEFVSNRQKRQPPSNIQTGYNPTTSRGGADLRAKSTQAWRTGNVVDVGFVKDLLVSEEHPDGSFTLLARPDEAGRSQSYNAKPHEGLSKEGKVEFVPAANKLEFEAAKHEAIEAAPDLRSLMTDDDWEFMASQELHQSGEPELPKPRIVSTKAMQEAVLRNEWARHGADLDYEDLWETRAGQKLWEKEVEQWNEAHGTEFDPDNMPFDSSTRSFTEYFDKKHLAGKKAKFPGIKEANEFFENDSRPDRGAYLEGEFELYQHALGSFLPREGKPGLIKLAKDANASTFIHESGHDFLEQMMRDDAHPAAPAELKADAQAVRDWLGIESHADLNTGWPGERGKAARRAHEKFARGFEQYLREGIAPSKELARVFAQFKQWLTQIYQTLRGLGDPINDDIRRVFDRMLTRPDEAVVAPERPGVEAFDDRHEAVAESTIPAQAHETAETIQAESDKIVATHLPEEQDARFGDVEEEAGRRTPGGPKLDRHGNEPEAPAGEGGAAAKAGAVEAGGGEVAAEGAGARPAAGPAVKTKPPASANERFEDDKTGNIVIPNLNTSEDVAAVIRKTASENNNFREVRGPIPDSEVLALAEAMGMDAAYLDTRKIGEAWTAPQIVALRNLLIKSAAAVRDAMIKAATGNPEALMEYAEVKARHVMIQKTVSSVTAEAGRALRAFQGRFTEGMAEANQIGAFLKNATGKTLFQLQREAKFGASLETPQQLALFIDSSERKGFAPAIIEYYVNALISGPVTHMRYMAGNVVKMLATPLFEIPAAAAVGRARELTGAGPQADRVYLGEVAPALYGIMKGSRDGLWKAWDAFQTGVSEPLPGERISPHFMTPGGAIPGLIGTALRTPGRSVSAIHTFFKTATYEMSIQRLAYRTAMNEGLEGDAFTNRVADLTVRPTSTMMTQATKGALKELFMAPTDYNSVSGQLTRAFNNPSPAGLALKIMAPFMKIGTQITREAFVERTPLGIASKEVRENLSFKGGEAGQGAGAAFDEQMAKQVTGIALVGASVGLTLEGVMTGDGPEDPEKRAVWLLSHRPNSVQIGNITIPYQGLGGLGMLMRFAANMTHTAHGWDEEDGTKLAKHFMMGFTKSVLDDNFMRGIKDFLDAFYHYDEYGPNYIRQFATNWLPFSVGMGQVARMVDPYQRESKSIFQAAQAKVPWLSERLMPRRDMFGEPMPNSAAEAAARYANDPVVKAMDDVRIGFPTLKRDIRGVELTDEQFDELSLKAGRMAKMRLDKIVAMPGFGRMPPEMRIELMHKAVDQSRETARKLIMIQNPEIVRAATDNKIGKKMGAVPVNQKPTQTVH